MQMPPWIGKRFPSEPLAAVDCLRRLLDEGMLQEIAEADYAYRAADHLAALMPIWERGELATLNSWYPVEVLELIRWSEPEDPTWKPGSTGTRGHTMRAFSCAALLARPGSTPDKETLIQMLDSVRHLGPEAQEAMGRFLVSRINSLGPGYDRPFAVIALVAIVQAIDPTLCATNEQDLADWIVSEEASERESGSPIHEKRWLFGLSSNDMRNERWVALIEALRQSSGENPLGRMLARHHQAACCESPDF